VHRIGRTGRAGTPGEAISLVGPDDESMLPGIERLLRRKLERAQLAAEDRAELELLVKSAGPDIDTRPPMPPRRGQRSGSNSGPRGSRAPAPARGDGNRMSQQSRRDGNRTPQEPRRDGNRMPQPPARDGNRMPQEPRGDGNRGQARRDDRQPGAARTQDAGPRFEVVYRSTPRSGTR
jgi:superfamily II DNA/RNA helicase